jgi:sulfate adenylyltransferase subunit 1 (EFTu-like GTPase family)
MRRRLLQRITIGRGGLPIAHVHGERVQGVTADVGIHAARKSTRGYVVSGCCGIVVADAPGETAAERNMGAETLSKTLAS